MKKKLIRGISLDREKVRKIWMTMRLIVILFFVSLLHVSASVYSQKTKLNIRVENASLQQVFKVLQEQSEFDFFYKNEQIPAEARVSIQYQNESIEVILDKILSGTGLTYHVLDTDIVISAKGVAKSEMNSQQQKSVSGKVSDSSGASLPGVSVVVKGTTNGTITDANGNYSLSNIPENAMIQFSFVGMKAQEVVVGNNTTINVKLQDETIGIEEVVAVGYGVQKKVNLTGAVGQVNSDVLEGKPVTNVQELLQGKTPGLNITKSSGAPGSGASINIRGTSTIGGSSGVLVIIDGVPGNISTLNSNDIESISVLKDAASASIYGSRAANGVILVTTKSGNMNKELQVTMNVSTGVTNPLHFIDFVGGKDFMSLYNLARKNEGNAELYKASDFQDLSDGKIKEVVWNKEIFKKNQLLSNNHVSLSGKTEKIQYNFSGSYDYQSGTVPQNDYNRYIFKPDITLNLTKWLKLRSNVQYTETIINEPQGGTNGGIDASLRISPITPITNATGQYWGPGGTPGGNPIALVNLGGKNKDRYKEMLSIFTATITPLKNWSIVPLVSFRSTDRLREEYTKPITLYKNDGTVYSKDPLSIQSIAERSFSDLNKLYQVTSNYTFTINDNHNLGFLAGYSQEYNYHEDFWASRKSPAFNDIYVLDAGMSAKDNGGTKYQDAIQSAFARINYDFEGKYLFEANMRADGSSRFSPEYRWGTFPSFSAGWNIHQEKFFAENLSVISKLKIRGSYGILGDALKISRYETRNLLSFNAKAYGYNGSIAPGAWSSASFVNDISWEKAKMTNFGVEMGIWNNRLEITFDYFNNIRQDILYRAPVPSEYGLAAPVINALKMQNQGIEGIVSFKNDYKGLKYGFDMNFNYSKNEVLDLYGTGPWKGTNNITDVGTQLEMLYGYESLGLFQDDADITSSAKQVNVKPGNIKYMDQNNDKVIDGKDRVILNDKTPIRFGINMELEYKGFDVSANLYGLLNNYRYLQGYEGWAFYLTTNARPMHLDSWTVDNKDASYPRLTTNMLGNDREFSNFWLRKANYLKIQNVQIGYTLPSTLCSKIAIDNARIYLSGQNLGIISNYVGFDPEGGSYPLARTFSFGLQLKF